MPPLPKHLRPRWRYLAVRLETWPDAELTRRRFQAAAWTAARELYGDSGAARLDLTVIRFESSDGTGEAIVRTRRGETDGARAVLATIAAVDEEPIGLFVAGISGTVRACEEKYLGRRAESTEQRTVDFDDAERRATVRATRVDVAVDGADVGATTLDLH